MGRLGARPTAVLVAPFLAAAGWAWQGDTVFRVDVKLVRLLVTVKDAQGGLVGSLEKPDFRVSDSGVAQEIALFEHHTAQPLSVALAMDTSGSAAKDLHYAVDASSRFLAALTREGNPKDALSFFTFNHDVTQRFGFTRSGARFKSIVKELKAEAGTSLYDAVALASETLDDREGRRVLIVVTDGGDTTSRYDFHRALEAAHRADAAVYSIVIVPITNDSGRNIGGEHALIQFARSTGGRTFFPSAGPALDQTFATILRELRSQYLVGYYPKGLPESKNRFRTVKVELSRPELTVSTRSGYYQ